jgi:primosomal protein N'
MIDLDLSLVDRADGTQARALLHALSGRNLVIQGPPGTGKSQTITNLIAAVLQRGKTVLFVAEKLAALEVVRRRLRELGLGDFCLELHSHKTRKKSFFEDIKVRLEKTPDRSVGTVRRRTAGPRSAAYRARRLRGCHQ